MKNRDLLEKKEKVIWKEKQKILTLTGEPVLEMSLSWPEVAGKKRWNVRRYYRLLSEGWEKQWCREVYWCACADLAQKRAASRHFVLWKASLSGQVTRQDEQLLSIAMLAREEHGDGRGLEYRWGDTWRWEDGSPVRLKEFFPGKHRWRRELLRQAEDAAQRARERGCCLAPELKGALRRWFSAERFVVEKDGLLLYYPQCTVASAAEGAVTLHIPFVQSWPMQGSHSV